MESEDVIAWSYFASVTRKNMLSPKETFMEDVWILVSDISEKKVVPSCLL